MNPLRKAFEHGPAFIPFVTAGDPSAEKTVAYVVALANAGADIVELGVPFSDPIADGPVIQAAGLRAFAGGVTVERVFDIVAAIRQQTQVPLVFLTYANIPFKYGYERFCARCAKLKVAGLVIPDLPAEEAGELLPAASQNGVAIIPLVSPTSGHRLAKLTAHADGFVYIVSALGVTGTRDGFAQNLDDLIADLRNVTDAPLCVGFGIHTPEQASAIAGQADGVIVGSAIVKLIADAPDDLAGLAEYAGAMADATHSGRGQA
ncbi:tryptophan synthase subunit alpha [Lacticaseibacillus mingshuiensis]|uniref:Tryptophan synthase alpha chain n=1 Tax=Lacticaseibacillus mingshuiensis TaxID=2799574 RepID=A0ABW4CG88_9LACO|nr:tryptophan synthase subunit alpha [Lacticaseibacillus mingshuiensis]